MRRILAAIDAINDRIGKAVSFLVIAIVGVMVYEVIARYVFDAPTKWAYETVTFILGAYAILGGAYALRHGAHVNMDILHSRLSPRRRAILDVITSVFFFLFCVVLLWKGSEWAARSIRLSEHTWSPWGPPVYPVKILIPIGAFLLLLQGLSKLIRDLLTAFTGARSE